MLSPWPTLFAAVLVMPTSEPGAEFTAAVAVSFAASLSGMGSPLPLAPCKALTAKAAVTVPLVCDTALTTRSAAASPTASAPLRVQVTVPALSGLAALLAGMQPQPLPEVPTTDAPAGTSKVICCELPAAFGPLLVALSV